MSSPRTHAPSLREACGFDLVLSEFVLVIGDPLPNRVLDQLDSLSVGSFDTGVFENLVNTDPCLGSVSELLTPRVAAPWGSVNEPVEVVESVLLDMHARPFALTVGERRMIPPHCIAPLCLSHLVI